MRLGFTGDVMLGRLVDERQRTRGTTAVWGDLLADLQALDGVCINLECCLSTRGEPWHRTYRPYLFRADPDWAVPALTAANVAVAVLANNHVLDYDERALLDTLDALDGADIPRAGAGRDREEAFRPVTFEAGDLTVGVLSLTDNTPEYAAGPDSPGTAHVAFDVDDPDTTRAVRAALDALDADLTVASLHWGPNMRVEPPAAFRRFGRWLVRAGVDVVHGHSAHVFQGIQVYRGHPILYDTGDFVDDYAVDQQLRNDRSFLFELELDGTRPTNLRCRPTEIDGMAVHHASPAVAAWCRETMRDRSGRFGTRFERDGESLVVPLA
jgi:poly-gamma-glutamate capsule biosynthesis protein CapA/YwtB (metallophosphatase superfamily)